MEATPFNLAQRYIGLREYPGKEASNPHIEAWLADAGIPNADDQTPWCGAFTGHCAGRLCGLPVPRGYARARSWLTVGTPAELRNAEPGFDVVILKRGRGEQPGPDVIDAPGHVGFFAGLEGERGQRVLILAGNQGDAVTVQAFPVASVLGVRRLSL